MPKPMPPLSHTTVEATAFLAGLHQEFRDQIEKYRDLTRQLHEMEARVELTEKTLCLIREHLRLAVGRAEAAFPRDWERDFNAVRFVGVRLADACVAVLRDLGGPLSLEEIMCGLNLGMFRFRTSSPLREIHAALLKQRQVKKVGDKWVWVGEQPHQTKLRLVNAGSASANSTTTTTE